MKGASIYKSQRAKVTQFDPLYLLSPRKQGDSKTEDMDESNMFKENNVKQGLKYTYSFAHG